MARSTVSELHDLLSDEQYPIQLRDPKTGKVLHTLTSYDSLLPFEVARPQFSVEGNTFCDNINGEEISLDDVRKALALVTRAVRTKKAIRIEDDDNDSGFTVIVSPKGSVQFGCQSYTVAQVKEAADAIRAARK